MAGKWLACRNLTLPSVTAPSRPCNKGFSPGFRALSIMTHTDPTATILISKTGATHRRDAASPVSQCPHLAHCKSHQLGIPQIHCEGRGRMEHSLMRISSARFISPSHCTTRSGIHVFEYWTDKWKTRV